MCCVSSILKSTIFLVLTKFESLHLLRKVKFNILLCCLLVLFSLKGFKYYAALAINDVLLIYCPTQPMTTVQLYCFEVTN